MRCINNVKSIVHKISSLPPIGSLHEGGHYAGLYRHGGNHHALIVSRIEGEFYDEWSENSKEIKGCDSNIDGMANTKAMAAAGSQLAMNVLALDLGGFTDWYIPANKQLEMCYRQFKPTNQENYSGHGLNEDSYSAGREYTKTNPTQTKIIDFMKGMSPDAFKENWYWSSTQRSAHYAFYQYFNVGSQYYYSKASKSYARAVRSFLVC
jgi:hypothetical protein